jgi:TDG/mug DNA glycosylase family protein
VAHYYAGRGNEFWQPLYEAGLIGEALDHTDDSRAVEFGVGLTDLGRYIASSSDKGMRERFDPYAFVDRVAHHAPRWIAFNGKEAATRRSLLPVGSDPVRKAGPGILAVTWPA